MSARRVAHARLLLLVLVALLVIAFAWAPGCRAPYQYDDHVTPVKDPASQSLAAWWQHVPETLRPLTKLSFAVESSLSLTRAPERRVFQGLLFALVVVLLGLLLHDAGARPFTAVSIATLFGVHPVHAESVLALAGRSALLALALTLASAFVLVRGRHALALFFSVAALIARETALVWLVACVFLVVAARARTEDDRHTRAVIVSAVCALLGALVVFSSSRMRTLVDYAWSDTLALEKLGLQWAALPVGFFRLVVAPSSFTVDMEFSPHGLARFSLILTAFAMGSASLWIGLRQSLPFRVRVAALLFVALVLPTHSVFPKLDPLTARDVSVASAVLVWLMVALAMMRPAFARVVARAAPTVVLVVVFVVPLVWLTRARAHLSRDPIALWRDAAERTETATRPLINLGTLLAQQGALEEAHDVFTEVLRRDPKHRDAHERREAVEVLIETRALLREPSPTENVEP